jgi:aminoglycoside phosphotransferase (APT) family kinase protein
LQRTWEPEIVVDEKLARRLIREQFPSVQVEQIELLGVGWDNTVYVVDRIYTFRFPRREVAVQLLHNESHALPLLGNALPLRIPKLLFLGRASDDFKWPFAGYEFLSDTPADELALDEHDRAANAHDLGVFLSELHSQDKNKFPKLPGDTIGRMSLEKWLPRLDEFFSRFELDGLDLDYYALRTFVEQLGRIRPEPGAPNVVHGDFYVRHLLVNEVGRIQGVIDWGDIHLNDPAQDLSIMFSFLPPPSRENFLHAYGNLVTDTQFLLARMRALVLGCNLLSYARDTENGRLRDESLFILKNSAL